MIVGLVISFLSVIHRISSAFIHSFRYSKRNIFYLLVLLIIAGILLTGCGRIDIDINTTVSPSGEILQEMQFIGSGLMGAALSDAETIQNYNNNGWQTTLNQNGDSVSLLVSKTFKSSNSMSLPLFTDSNSNMDLQNIKFDVDGNFFMRDYYLELQTPPSSNLADSGDEWAEVTDAMIDAMFGMTWTFTLPGQIVDTNADTFSGSSGTWIFDYQTLKTGRAITMHTRYINWPVIAMIFGLLGFIIVVVLLFFRSRKREVEDTYYASEYCCPRCGFNIQPGTQFCASCGLRIYQNDNQPPVMWRQFMYCPRCRRQVNSGLYICPFCGMRLG